MFIWAKLHGLAGSRQANVMHHLMLAPGVARDLPADMLARIGLGLALGQAGPPSPAAASVRKAKP